MPSKNEEKIYIKNSYYHIYNRGVEKRKIFQDREDYSTFLSYLKTYLIPKDEESIRQKISNSTTPIEKNKLIKLLNLNNFSNELSLIAYNLMPNHFHLLVYQTEENTIDRFMNSLGTRYSMYFNRKNDRVGPLFQGIYKAVIVESDEQLLHLSRYIHSQQDIQGHPLDIALLSSYSYYVKATSQDWVKSEHILKYFQKNKPSYLRHISTYKDFMDGMIGGLEEDILSDIKID